MTNHNCLDAYYGATWHWKVTLAGAGSGVIIAESAKTAVSIKSANIQTQYTPSFKNHAPIATKIEMQLFEPMGARLYDNILSILAMLGIKNVNEATFILQVSFCGWDSDGNGKINIAPVTYKCNLIEISSVLTEQGSEYHCEFVPIDNIGQRDAYYVIPVNFQVKDKGAQETDTVGKVVDKLLDTWNEHIKKTYNDQLIQYSIDFQGWQGDPKSWKIIADDPSKQPQRQDLGANVGKSQGIDAFIHMLLNQTKEGAALATQNTPDKKDYLETPGDPNASIAVVISKVKINYGHFNEREGQFQKQIQFIVKPFQTIKAIVNQKHAEAIGAGSFSSKILGWLKGDRIPRVYYYIFTGKNQDVLKLDLKFNGTVILNLPYFEGRQTETFTSGREALINDKDHYDKYVVAKQPPNEASAPEISSASGEGGGVYMDDWGALPSNVEALRRISFIFSHTDTLQQARSQGEAWHSREKAAYSKVLEQLNENPSGGFLQEIDMDIRGDPFWIGLDGTPEGSEEIIKTELGETGDIAFALKVVIPMGNPAYDEAQMPNLHDSDFYTGIYRILSAENRFEPNGFFTQTLHAAKIFQITSDDAKSMFQ